MLLHPITSVQWGATFSSFILNLLIAFILFFCVLLQSTVRALDTPLFLNTFSWHKLVCFLGLSHQAISLSVPTNCYQSNAEHERLVWMFIKARLEVWGTQFLVKCKARMMILWEMGWHIYILQLGAAMQVGRWSRREWFLSGFSACHLGVSVKVVRRKRFLLNCYRTIRTICLLTSSAGTATADGMVLQGREECMWCSMSDSWNSPLAFYLDNFWGNPVKCESSPVNWLVCGLFILAFVLASNLVFISHVFY